MAHGRLNWSVIGPDPRVGSGPCEPSDLDALQAEAGASALLSLQSDECLAKRGIDYPAQAHHGHALGLTMARVPLRDFDSEDQRRGLPAAVRALYGLLRQGHRVYVHCTVGLNRAPLVVLAYLTLVEGLNLEAARDLLRRARPGVFPSEEAYAGCCMDLAAQYGDRIRQRARELRQGSALPEQEAWRLAKRAIWRQALTAE